MRPGLRTVGAIVAGIVTAYVLIIVAEVMTSRLYPMPAGLTPANDDAMRSWIQQLPAGAFALVLCGWALGAFAGGFVSAKIEHRPSAEHAIIVGALLLCASVLNMVRIPHPLWMWIGAFVLIVPAAYMGARLASAPGHHALRSA